MPQTLPWSAERPHTLVIACSDGRFQEQLDDYLHGDLGIRSYDRLYLPGGPGALTASDLDFSRADRQRWECDFLLKAHEIERVILVFHSGAADGPDEAMCADYRRRFPTLTTAQLRAQQETDARELLLTHFGGPDRLRVEVLRAETTAQYRVRFVGLGEG